MRRQALNFNPPQKQTKKTSKDECTIEVSKDECVAYTFFLFPVAGAVVARRLVPLFPSSCASKMTKRCQREVLSPFLRFLPLAICVFAFRWGTTGFINMMMISAVPFIFSLISSVRYRVLWKGAPSSFLEIAVWSARHFVERGAGLSNYSQFWSRSRLLILFSSFLFVGQEVRLLV